MEHIKIPLFGKYGKEKFTLVDGDYDGEYFNQYKWYVSPLGYVIRPASKYEDRKEKTIYLHREVLKLTKGLNVDHINRDKLDNRSINLRPADKKQNCQNRISITKNKNGYKGVFYPTNGRKRNKDGKMWQSNKPAAVFRGKYLGMFDNVELAAKAWDKEAKKHYGKYGVYNF